MRRFCITAAILSLSFATRGVQAQAVAVTAAQQIAAAHDGILELYDRGAQKRLWKSDGLRNPTAIIIGASRLALLDAVSGEIRIVDIESGKGTTIPTVDTPVDAAFVDADLFVVERDAGRIERFAANGERSVATTGAFPSFLRVANGRLYVYSRRDGMLQELSPSPLAVVRSRMVGSFASDLETEGTFAFLVFPKDGSISATKLDTFEDGGETRIGSTPVDLLIYPASKLKPATLVVADPSARRVFTAKGPESETAAFGRDFVHGLIGFSLFAGRQAAFPQGVDRVAGTESHPLAYDSSSGTLFSYSDKKAEVLAKGIGPHAYAATADGAVWWNGTLVAQKLN